MTAREVSLVGYNGSSRQADQNLLFFKKNIKGRKAKFWLGARQNPSSSLFTRTALNSKDVKP